MADRPILFSASMVRALINGRKTQTRRILKLDPEPIEYDGMWMWKPGIRWGAVNNPTYPPMRYAPGDRLWVKETFRFTNGFDRYSPGEIALQCAEAGYKRPWAPIHCDADGAVVNWYADPHTFGTGPGRTRSSIHMPRWASRLTLTVTDVRVQRLQDISEEDARAEGVQPFGPVFSVEKANGLTGCGTTARAAYAILWNSLHGPGAWDANPFVVALTFTVRQGNIDA